MNDDFIDELMDDEKIESQQIEETQIQINESDLDIEDNQSQEDNSNDDSFISDLLKSRGIEDLSKIKFENDEGEIEEVDWNTLSKEDKLNIFNSSTHDPETDLDESEIQLINIIRQSQLNPQEYIQYVQQSSIQNYLENINSNQINQYKVNELTDDELFVADLVARTNITEEEAFEYLDKLKSNQDLFKKQIDGIRLEYQKSEDERLMYNEIKRQEEQQKQFNIFANGIVNEITNFNEFAGCDLNMDNEDKQELYEFITGFDSAGNSHFGKALNDPNLLVKMAWFALNGEQMIQDINDYYKKEISNVRKESYNKGLKDRNKSNIVHKPINNISKSDIFDDLD